MEYRREIDGLRAIAVIPVILFHSGFPLFSGGFVGVDVFFVISGYLITTIILSEMKSGTFSLINFYERRARRIIPALYLIMLLSILFSWLWLSPSHMKDFSESLVAVSLFVSNVLFWQETGYWEVENGLKPLLHTWSLAVEEQYYVLFPLFLMFMWRFRNRWILGSFLSIATISLLFSQWAAFNKPAANFFLLPTRSWELAIGAGIAFYFLYRKKVMLSLLSNQIIDEIFGAIGIALISYSVFYFNENTPFPSLYALFPTVGAALIIVFASKKTVVGKWLGSRLLVSIGLVSYSAYLWHQPLLVFVRHRSLHEPDLSLMGVISLVSLLLAFFSWKFIEVPFRNKNIYSRQTVFTLVAVGSIVFVTVGVAGHITNGWQHRVDDNLSRMITDAQKGFSKKLCELNNTLFLPGVDHCVLVGGDKNAVILYGDSHAEALAFEAKKAFSKTDFSLILVATNGCPPVKDVYRADDSNKESCYEKNKRVYSAIENNSQIEYVILSARWTLGMEGRRFDNKEGGVERGRRPHLDIVKNGKYLYHKNYSHQNEIAEEYIKSIQSLLDAGKKVILVYPVPEVGWNVPDYISRYYMADPNTIYSQAVASTSYEVFKDRNKRAINALDRVKSNENLFRVIPEELFCNNGFSGRCIVRKGGVIYYRDDDHLSNAGSRLILDKVMRYF